MKLVNCVSKSTIAVFLSMSLAVPIAYADPVPYGQEYQNMTNNPSSISFSDLGPDNWAYKFVMEMVNRGVLKGYPDGRFRPDHIISRAEFATIMVKAGNLFPKKGATSSFADIKPSDWESPFVEAAKPYLMGDTAPDGSVYYKPNDPALREDITVAVVRLKGYEDRLPDQSIIQTMFSDYDGISEIAKNDVAIAVGSGLVSGYPDGTFQPQKPLTRAEAAALLWRAFMYGNDNKVGLGGSKTSPGTTPPTNSSTGSSTGTAQPPNAPSNPVDGHTLSGVMMDADGKLFFSGIYLTDSHGKYYSRTSGNPSTGEYAFNNLPDGAYDVHFYYPGYVVDAPKHVTLKGSDLTNVTVKLAVGTYTLQGTSAKADGTPLSNQQVTLKDPQNVGGYWQPTGTDGSFTLKGIAPGSYTLQIGDPNHPLASLDITVKDQDITELQVVGK